jgi:hypothetical protein
VSPATVICIFGNIYFCLVLFVEIESFWPFYFSTQNTFISVENRIYVLCAFDEKLQMSYHSRKFIITNGDVEFVIRAGDTVDFMTTRNWRTKDQFTWSFYVYLTWAWRTSWFCSQQKWKYFEWKNRMVRNFQFRRIGLDRNICYQKYKLQWLQYKINNKNLATKICLHIYN